MLETGESCTELRKNISAKFQELPSKCSPNILKTQMFKNTPKE